MVTFNSQTERKPRYFWPVFFVLLGCLIVFGIVFGGKWFGNKMMNEAVNAMPAPPATISTAPAQSMTWDNRIDTIGSFAAVQGTEVTTEAGGIVSAIHFESGARVKKGAALLTLDAANERADLKRLQAQAELSELNRARREKLYKLEAIAKSDLDAAVSEANAAKSAVDAQAAKLAQKEIRAPFAGVLGIRKVNLGQYLSPGTAIVTLQSVDPIFLDFSLPEQFVGQVSEGLVVTAAVDAFANESFSGKVVAVEPRIDSATRNFNVRAQLPNTDARLLGGVFGKLTLTLPGQRQVLVVPRSAVAYSSYGTSVYVPQKQAKPAEKPEKPQPGMPPWTDLEVSQRFIKTGEARGDFVIVTEGLKPGEQVATAGLLKLRNLQPVLIDNTVQPKPELNPTPVQN